MKNGRSNVQYSDEQKEDSEFSRKIAAIEFAEKFDDDKNRGGLQEADVVVIGVSRTSKTPICMYLAFKGIKAANVPLIPGTDPPEELFKIPPLKIIGLTINPQRLNEIRQVRLKTMGLTSGGNYTDINRIITELEFADGIFRKIGCAVIDVTNRAVEEVANRLLEEIYHKRG